VPLGFDVERAKRGSQDGPLSAGTSSPKPPLGPSSFRGAGFPTRDGRGGARGRPNDWDRGGRRRGGGFYDDRDRYGGPRSRSQEGRWREDDRERRDSRYTDSTRDIRDEHDLRDRDRDLIRPKPDRVSNEPPLSTRNIPPPPPAPSAPAFGSVPRLLKTTDIQSLTGKPPPTEPKALRPLSAGHTVGSDRQPPIGPPKPVLRDGIPPIPTGPRALQQKWQQLPNKQWINPALAGKKIPESPKVVRSQGFVLQQQKPFGSYRPDSSYSDRHPDFERRPGSSDAQSDSQVASTDGRPRGWHISGPNDGEIKSERDTQAVRASVDRGSRTSLDSDVKMGGIDAPEPPSREAGAEPGDQEFGVDPPWPQATDIQNAPTDSGYASLSRPNDKVDAPKASENTIPAITDTEDTFTIYSLAQSVAEDDAEMYISQFVEALADYVSSEAQTDLEDPRFLQTVVNSLPSLLRAFALRLGYVGSSVAERQVMYFIHKQRR